MSGRNGTGDVPVWLWVVGAIVFFRVVDDFWGFFPLVVIGFVLWQIYGNGRRKVQGPGSGPQPGTLSPPAPAGEQTYPGPYQGEVPASPGSSPDPSAGGPPPPTQMPRIDVPTYPGAAGPPGTVGPTGLSGPSGDDPAVSLGRLQLAQTGRDLREARASGDQDRVRHVLGQVGQAVDRVEQALATSPQQHSAGGRRLRSDLGRLRDQIGTANRAGSGVDHPLIDRIATAAVSMGQTGTHEHE